MTLERLHPLLQKALIFVPGATRTTRWYGISGGSLSCRSRHDGFTPFGFRRSCGPDRFHGVTAMGGAAGSPLSAGRGAVIPAGDRSQAPGVYLQWVATQDDTARLEPGETPCQCLPADAEVPGQLGAGHRRSVDVSVPLEQFRGVQRPEQLRHLPVSDAALAGSGSPALRRRLPFPVAGLGRGESCPHMSCSPVGCSGMIAYHPDMGQTTP